MNSIEQDENEMESFFKFCHRKIVSWQIQDLLTIFAEKLDSRCLTGS